MSENEEIFAKILSNVNL